jgi:hypothetical protein
VPRTLSGACIAALQEVATEAVHKRKFICSALREVGQLQRVMVLADGFAWKDKIYPSLTKVAFALTGTRWNGPRFFGLRDKPSTERRP